MFNISKVGAYITILRKSKKMTQGKLAEQLGISHQAVSNWERGAALPDITLLLDLACALGTSVDNLLSASRDDFKGFDEILDNIKIVPARPCEKCGAPAVDEAAMLRELEDNLSKISEL